MANFSDYVIGLNDQLGVNNIELSNVGGELVVQTIGDLNSTSQPKKVVTVTNIDLSQYTEGENPDPITDTYLDANTFAEVGYYLIDYEFSGNYKVDECKDDEETLGSSIDNAFVYFKHSKIEHVEKIAPLVFDPLSGTVSNIAISTLDSLKPSLDTTIPNIVSFNTNSTITIGGDVDGSITSLVGTRKLTITKLS